MKITSGLVVGVTFCLFACEKVKDTAKETIHKSGETVGQATSQFVEGVSKGIDKTYLPNLSLSDSVQARGVTHGTYMITHDSLGKDNVLSVYLIFEKPLKTVLKAKAFDEHGMEIGRASVKVNQQAGEADYVDFHFNKRTEIGAKCRLVVE